MDNVSVNFNLNITLKGDNSDIATADLGTAKDEVAITRGVSYDDGDGVDQCDVIYHDILPVTTADEVDLNGVVLKDAFGVGLAITKLKALYIKNLTGVELHVGGAANPLVFITPTPATEKLIIPINGQWFMSWPGAGITITGAGELEFTHAGAGAQNVELIAVGVR